MNTDSSFFTYFLDAGAVVKCVMLLLFAVSVLSWTIIFQRGTTLKRARKNLLAFEDDFWSGMELSKLFNELSPYHEDAEGLETIFISGFKEFARLRKQSDIRPAALMDGVQRSMRIACSREIDTLEQHLSLLMKF